MAAQKGSEMLLKIDSAGNGTFVSFAGLRTKTFTVNAEMVDITNADSSNKMRELLAGAGIKSMSVTGSGVFTDATVDSTLRTEIGAQVIKDYQIVVPGLGTYEGAFQITQLQYAGEHNGEVTYDISLESAGDITFT